MTAVTRFIATLQKIHEQSFNADKNIDNKVWNKRPAIVLNGCCTKLIDVALLKVQ